MMTLITDAINTARREFITYQLATAGVLSPKPTNEPAVATPVPVTAVEQLSADRVAVAVATASAGSAAANRSVSVSAFGATSLRIATSHAVVSADAAAFAAETFALSREPNRLGSATPERTPMITTTTISSTRLKPFLACFRFLVRRC